MKLCMWCINQDTLEDCGLPATKCVTVIDYEGGIAHTDPVWLCDKHYNDPEVEAYWKQGGLKWVY